MTSVLTASMEGTRASRNLPYVVIIFGDMLKPTVKKNNDNRMDLKGLTSASIWNLYLDSDNNTPAAKAPRVLDRPSVAVSPEQDRTVRRVNDKSADWLRVEATKEYSGGRMNRPMDSNKDKDNRALEKARERAARIERDPVDAAIAGGGISERAVSDALDLNMLRMLVSKGEDAAFLANCVALGGDPFIKLAIIGMPTKIGTTAKSWKRRIPKDALP